MTITGTIALVSGWNVARNSMSTASTAYNESEVMQKSTGDAEGNQS